MTLQNLFGTLAGTGAQNWSAADVCHRKLYIKLVLGLLVGTALEFYDFAVYSQLGKYVGPNFFPGVWVAHTAVSHAALLCLSGAPLVNRSSSVQHLVKLLC